MTRSLILSGGGAYADPWHPFAATPGRIAEILTALGHHVEISELVADRVADLRGWDLIVVNAASGPEADTGAAQAGLTAALERGLGVLAIHVTDSHRSSGPRRALLRQPRVPRTDLPRRPLAHTRDLDEWFNVTLCG